MKENIILNQSEVVNWIEGSPPDFGEERIWIVAEIPSLFLENASGYRTFLWGGKSWSDKTVMRANRWTLLPLPKEGQVIQDTGNSDKWNILKDDMEQGVSEGF